MGTFVLFLILGLGSGAVYAALGIGLVVTYRSSGVVNLATGVGTDSQRPFALVIVSGLFTRLLISIFLMPALYLVVARPDDRLEV